MDLKELRDVDGGRHPWETARLKAVKEIIAPCLFEGIRLLDVGCGDGFAARGISSGLQKKDITAVDINLTDELIGSLGGLSEGICYQRGLPQEGSFDMILLLDVIEHVEDDKGFLALLAEKYLKKGGKVMITVPAFQLLYGGHDRFLGHFRRYDLTGLEALVKESGLKALSSGHLFFSLLLPKLIFYKLFRSDKATDGIGSWGGGKVLTKAVECVLRMDNSLLFNASRIGLKIPGLTGWVLCEKR